jgi:putative protein-disulfide isomerase
MTGSATILYYVHDPMCSWCWAFRPMLLELRDKLPGDITWQNVLGGLAPDNDEPMPEQTRAMVQGHWQKIQSMVGSEFNFDFWSQCEPRRDTYKACRAVVAASWQQAEEAMIEAIQKAYYLRAMNPSEPETLIELAAELGLDRCLFSRDLDSEKTETAFRYQLQLRAELYVRSFPSLVLEHDSRRTLITHDYHGCGVPLSQIHAILKHAGQETF